MYYTFAIYKDKNENILIIPYAVNENGMRNSANRPTKISFPYSEIDIGKVVKESFDGCVKNPFIKAEEEKDVWYLATGIKSWKKFSEGRLLVDGILNSEKEYSFSASKRTINGSYLNLTPHVEFKLPLTASEEEIGATVLKAFEHSKC